MQTKVFGVAEAAEQLRLSSSTLAKWRMAGTGPKFIKAGRRVLYREQDLIEWLSESARRSTSEDAMFSHRPEASAASLDQHDVAASGHRRWRSDGSGLPGGVRTARAQD